MDDIHEVTELITTGPAEALAGLLGVPGPGGELPLLWHWVYQARSRGPAEYSYRLVAPLYEDQGLVVSATPEGGTIGVSCRDVSGRVTATGVIRLG
jgi:hypothetical protein